MLNYIPMATLTPIEFHLSEWRIRTNLEASLSLHALLGSQLTDVYCKRKSLSTPQTDMVSTNVWTSCVGNKRNILLPACFCVVECSCWQFKKLSKKNVRGCFNIKTVFQDMGILPHMYLNAMVYIKHLSNSLWPMVLKRTLAVQQEIQDHFTDCELIVEELGRKVWAPYTIMGVLWSKSHYLNQSLSCLQLNTRVTRRVKTRFHNQNLCSRHAD